MLALDNAEMRIGSGLCLGFGGTNARRAACADGDITGFTSFDTPNKLADFFPWIAHQVLEAADEGHEWVVAGFPGPVSPDGKIIGPMHNVVGMNNRQHDLPAMLNDADSAIGKLLEDGFRLIAVNDGALSAHAAARFTDYQYDRTAALIIGTGVGTGIVDRAPQYSDVYNADTKQPLEIGHVILGSEVSFTYESRYSGPGIKNRVGIDPKDLDADHVEWQDFAECVGRMVMLLGLMNRAEVVVPCGGVGAGASNKYGEHLLKAMDGYYVSRNAVHKLFAPAVELVYPSRAQTFEMFGAEGVVRDMITRADLVPAA